MDEADRPEGMPRGLWESIRAQPERAPEHIALAAADRFAVPAARWAAMMAPHHEPAEAARVARKKHVRLSTVEGAALGLGGIFTAAVDLAAVAWIQSRMVFFIAGAYGFDPAHPMRPAELLALQDVYDTPAEARQALDGVGTPLALHVVGRRLQGRDDPLAARLFKLVGRRAANRLAARAIPLVSSPINAAQNRSATSQLGDRALRFYGG